MSTKGVIEALNTKHVEQNMELEERFEVERVGIEDFERRHGLPAIKGSKKRTVWARMLRKGFVEPLLSERLSAELKKAAPQTVAKVRVLVDQVRTETDAVTWIENLRHHSADPIAWVLRTAQAWEPPPLPAERHFDSSASARSIESNRLNREAAVFERQHGLADLEASSTAQRNYGRRSRYAYLKELDSDRLEHLLKVINRVTRAVEWISAFRSKQPLQELLEKAPSESRDAA